MIKQSTESTTAASRTVSAEIQVEYKPKDLDEPKLSKCVLTASRNQ